MKALGSVDIGQLTGLEHTGLRIRVKKASQERIPEPCECGKGSIPLHDICVGVCGDTHKVLERNSTLPGFPKGYDGAM